MSDQVSTQTATGARHTVITPVMRAAAVAGILGQVVLILGSWITTWLEDAKFDVARDDLSDMAALGAPHAWIVQLSDAFCGITTIAFAWLALRPALSGVRGRTQAAVLISLTWGLGALSDAAFRIDCRTADGCTPEQKIHSWHAAVHSATTPLLLVFAVVPYIVARCLRRSPQWARLARPCVVFGVAIDLVLVAGIALGDNWGAGYAQRLLILAATWVALLAAWVLHIAALPSARPPR